MSKAAFTRELGIDILEQLSDAPSTQISNCVQHACCLFLIHVNSKSDQELFDFIQGVSNFPVYQLSDKVAIGTISSFVQVLCDLKLHYERPTLTIEDAV